MSRARCATALLAAGLLAACSPLGGPRTEFRVFAPTTTVQADAAWPQADWQLTVMAVAANPMLDSPRIVVRPTDHVVQTYRGVRWADRSQELLETAVVDAFEESGKLSAVGRMANTARGDFALFMEVRAFETVYRDGQPEAVIEVQANLVQLRGSSSGTATASRRFRQVVPGSAPEVEAMVEAFSEAMSGMSADLVGWTLVEGNRIRAASAAQSSGK
ncbi:MAG: membrane integrity-associated transporter subunit PqiC [Arenimonas sp.]|nr:membrane integrity-associated transporter subunit PqiC [Arenimonas sp.]